MTNLSKILNIQVSSTSEYLAVQISKIWRNSFSESWWVLNLHGTKYCFEEYVKCPNRFQRRYKISTKILFTFLFFSILLIRFCNNLYYQELWFFPSDRNTFGTLSYSSELKRIIHWNQKQFTLPHFPVLFITHRFIIQLTRACNIAKNVTIPTPNKRVSKQNETIDADVNPEKQKTERRKLEWHKQVAY